MTMATTKTYYESSDDSDTDTLVQSLHEKDADVLNDHDEVEELLVKHNRNEPLTRQTKVAGKSKLNKRRRSRHAHKDEDTSLVQGMEEGFRDDSSTSSGHSDLQEKDWQQSSTARFSNTQIAVFSCLILVLFAALAYGSFSASRQTRQVQSQTFSNGTHVFQATTILISLDGFRADFLQRELTPSLNAFVASGVSPEFMLPSFPTVTFPNHYTLVTGLYPESHGIVSNQFWDPAFQEEFYYTNTTSSMQSKWWDAAEPIWVTAEKQGIKTAIHMWPGSEAHIRRVEPSYLDKYKTDEELPRKVARILELLDLDGEHRPQLIAAYVPDVDRDGHKFGPNSTEIRSTIVRADNMLSLLLEGLLHRNLTEIVNLVIVSDHGMATMSADRMVQLDNIMDMSLVDHIDGWPLRGLRSKNPERDVPIMYEQLQEAAAAHGTFDVYTLDTMPTRYHFSNNLRIAPLWIVPKAGHLVIEKADFNIAAAKEAGQMFHPIGAHGFDHEHPLMRAIFIARGPAFPHRPNSRVPVFQNIEVYNIVCDSLGLMPHVNNGTLRLPLQTEGLHSDFDKPEELSEDSAISIISSASSSLSISSTSTTEAATSTTGGSTSTTTTMPASTSSANTPPPTSDDHTKPEDGQSSRNAWLTYLREKLQQAKDWAKQFLESVKNNDPETNTSEVT